ncbi:hypothetical protein DOY81_012178 [Sarcophaga bullata]|nr:hypothetical protein DOY81_012178 [Sarcophaga bullata]
MVDLNCTPCAKPPPATTEEMTQPLSNPVKQLCRLCLREDDAEPDKVVDIFQEPDEDTKVKKLKLLKISFMSYSVLRIVTEALKLLQSNTFLADDEENRPGLNGNPGNLYPIEDCEIQEVNPEQDFESSEDDFSMESDSEPEDVVTQPVKVTDSNAASSIPKTLKAAVVKKAPAYVSPSNANVNLEPAKMNDNNIAKELAPNNVLMEHSNLEFTIKNTYTCQYCDMAFTTQNDCTEHESRHDPMAPFLCNFCHMRCGSRQTLIGHIKEAHDPERPYICVLCSKGFCRRSDLKKHSIVHTGIRPFVCPICAKSFSRNTNLTKHMRIHSSIKPYVCQQCPRSFTTGIELSRHGRTHSEARNFKCAKCPATYARKDKLHLHEQSHYRKETEFFLNANKPPQAILQNQAVMPPTTENMDSSAMLSNPEINQSKSTEQSSFPQNKPTPPAKSSHGRVHSCDICNKTFTRERDLQRHQALHLDTLFTCKQCGLGFSRREKLARHELEQHGPHALSAHQAVLNAAGVAHPSMELNQIPHHHSVSQALQQPQPPSLPPAVSMAVQRPSAADMSFYSNMVPTMNLGFYSETRPEDRNGI